MSTTRATRINQVKRAIAQQFANFIKSEIKRRGITQKDFAKLVGMQSQAISRITLADGAISVHMGTMIRVYDALGLVPVISRTKRKG